MNIILNSSTNVEYAAFYISGLYEVYGRNSLNFTANPFQDYNNIFNFIVEKDNEKINYVIDYSDSQEINSLAYEWCHLYGKINYKLNYYENFKSKIILLPPNFGIHIWDIAETLQTSIFNYIKSRERIVNVRKFFSKYYKQYKKLPIGSYKPAISEDNYIFSVSTLWNSDEWIRNDETVNLYRAIFFEACQSIQGLNFEGGFVYSQIRNGNPRFQHLMLNKAYIKPEEYLNKLKSSTLVFNTPAWAMCHGWKLGEYLALGKAIISTPLINELPEPLTHGENIHYVTGTIEEITSAVRLLIENKEYRRKLEMGAYQYYLKYAKPSSAIKLICK